MNALKTLANNCEMLHLYDSEDEAVD
jgi:hypothetical protein